MYCSEFLFKKPVLLLAENQAASTQRISQERERKLIYFFLNNLMLIECLEIFK